MAWMIALSEQDHGNEYRRGYDDALNARDYSPTVFTMDMDNGYQRGYEAGERRRAQGDVD